MPEQSPLDLIVIQIENISDSKQEAAIFSFTQQNENVKISSLRGSSTYEFIKMMLLKESYIIGHIQLQSEYNSIIETTICENQIATLGGEYNKISKLVNSFHLQQQQETTIAIRDPFFLVAGTAIKIDLLPMEKIIIRFYPAIRFYGEITQSVYNIFHVIKNKIPKLLGPCELLYFVKTKNFIDVINGGYIIIQPDWEMGITHIRTIGFYPESIIVGQQIIKSDVEEQGICIFKVNKQESHTPMKINIPVHKNGYVLFYKKIG